MLDTVEHGSLPSVDDRLPLRPMVLGTAADVGAYSGVLRRPIIQSTFYPSDPGFRSFSIESPAYGVRQVLDALNAHRFFAYDDGSVLRPWLCESWEYDERGVWTLHLREGVHWSDGVPFSLQDLRFAIDHSPLIGTPEYRDALRQRFEVVDDFQLNIHSSSLDALDSLARVADTLMLTTPSHYVRQQLPQLTDPERLNEWATAALRAISARFVVTGDAWPVWWRWTFDWRLNPELPTLNPWVLQTSPNADVFAYRRNPFCWQVDAQGQQLPYFDELTFTWTEPAQLRVALSRGEPDLVDQGLALVDHPWLREQLDAVTYALLACPSPGHLALQLNLSVPDPAKRALANDRRVRQAVSLLLQRETLNRTHYEGLLTPRQLAPVTGGRYAHEGLAEAYLAHDPGEANRLLDEAGYAVRDAEGYRLLPDGERVSWTLLEVSPTHTLSPDVAMIVEWLAAGGIECRPRAVTQEEYLMIWGRDGWDALYGRVELPVAPTLTQFGFWCGRSVLLWHGRFHETSTEPAMRPPDDHLLRALWTLWFEYGAATMEAERVALWQAAMVIWQRELPAIGVLGELPRLVVARQGLQGLDPDMLYADELGGLGGRRLALLHYGE